MTDKYRTNQSVLHPLWAEVEHARREIETWPSGMAETVRLEGNPGKWSPYYKQDEGEDERHVEI